MPVGIGDGDRPRFWPIGGGDGGRPLAPGHWQIVGRGVGGGGSGVPHPVCEVQRPARHSAPGGTRSEWPGPCGHADHGPCQRNGTQRTDYWTFSFPTGATPLQVKARAGHRFVRKLSPTSQRGRSEKGPALHLRANHTIRPWTRTPSQECPWVTPVNVKA
jgi:hypothetical protein